MNAQTYHDLVVPAAARFFPASFNSLEARALVIAIGLQESEFKHRRQLVRGFRDWWKSVTTPAAGFQQFERIGISEVLRHNASRKMALTVLEQFGYPEDVDTIHEALVHNDLLCAVWSRLALWRHPDPLPGEHEMARAWNYYLRIWAPGIPHPEKWEACWREAWRIVKAGAK
ncbi:MAG: hypothetical protein Q7W55_10535 [Pseudohongiella sp.]|nr:hypothetical protein [Pseudohongiella sp.]